MATQSERINNLENGIAAILAAMQGGAAPTVEAEEEPTASKPKGNSVKANTMTIPTATVTDDDGNRYRFTQAYQSSPKNSEPIKYRTPRVLIEFKAQGADDFTKSTTLLPNVLAAIASLPDAKIAAFGVDAREA